MGEILQGKGVVAGIAIGEVVWVANDYEKWFAKYNSDSPKIENEKLEKAIQKVQADLENNITTMQEKNMTEQAQIMQAHLLILKDPTFIDLILEKLELENSAPKALQVAIDEIAKTFEMMDDEYFRARAADIRDVGNRVLKTLLGIDELDFGSRKIILCGQDLEPSLIAAMPEENLQGIILGHGSLTSHVVIIAKAKGIPTIIGLEKFDLLENKAQVVLDGDTGEVVWHLAPTEEENYRKKLKQQEQEKEYYLNLAKKEVVTQDGHKVVVAANIGSDKDIDKALQFGCEGVGLFRSEFLFMSRSAMPNEEEQFAAYKAVVQKCGEKLCIIRTMDIGGDKSLEYLKVPPEQNPFLGWRALRISLKRPELFLPQLKAILRAGVYGNVAIMLPMVISLNEIIEAKEFIKLAQAELDKEQVPYSKTVSIGIMVETPAAAILADKLAQHVDFFSIGTNDLAQYVLAVDRGNENISYLYNYFNPAVLKIINDVIGAAKKNNIWVGMCGEMAGDILATELLVGMGIDELSMSGSTIPKVKERITKINLASAQSLVAEVLQFDKTEEVINYLKKK
ncbi:MAG: phosphoenolpyruvate--protein phosphotransferase [Negativicutes bacterium]|nr:phosphoenolpyruvate--protein phosphotransferase [Negativicutes bacterium]